MKLLSPKYIILDEIDSGLDIDAFATIANFLAKEKRDDQCLIIITHNFRMAEFLAPDEVIILQSGEITRR
jgi:Fe-S cluster assembly ATP-binding protein